MSENKLNLNWSAVEKALAEGTFSGYKIGILETEKLFVGFLNDEKIPGRTIDIKIKYVSNFLSRSDQLNYSRQLCKKIVSEPHFEISREETKQTIFGYWQAMLDLKEAITTLSVYQKMSLRFKYLIGKIAKKVKIIIGSITVAVLLIFFLYEVEVGRKAAQLIGQGVHSLIFSIGPWLLGAGLTIFIIWAGWKLLNKSRHEF